MVLAFSLISMLWSASPASVPEAPGPQMQIVAHEDDDLLFMNPTVQRAIDAGRLVVSVYLTAGDAGMQGKYWEAREAGIRAAYAAMAHEPNVWEQSFVRAGNATLEVFSIANPARIMVMFLHLPDGGDGFGFLRYHEESIRELWQHSINTIDTVDGRQTLSHDDIIGALVALLQLYRPSNVDLLDCTALHGWDHNDHFYSAMYGLAAVNQYMESANTQVALHRAYNINLLPPNVSPAYVAAKKRAVDAYIPFDEVLCPAGKPCEVNPLYGLWLEREYMQVGTFVEGSVNCMGWNDRLRATVVDEH